MDTKSSMNEILKWIEVNKVSTNKKNKPLEYKDHGFLMDYLLDTSQKIVVRKSTQVGMSLQTLLKVLYLGDINSITCLYILPTNPEAKNFVWTKVDPLIENSPGLSAKVGHGAFQNKPIWSSTLKQFSHSFFIFRGAYSSWQAQSIDADILCLDEFDQLKPEMVDQYEERVSGSNSIGLIYYFGNPSIPGYGISDIFDRSDQKNWFIRCPHCKKLQTLEWPVSINLEKKLFWCKYCHGVLSNEDRRVGKWVAKFRNREISGYQINRLMAPWVSAREIIDESLTKPKKHFYNFVLGLPYLEHGEIVSELDLRNCIGDYSETFSGFENNIVVGIDQGDEFHVVIGLASQPCKILSARVAKSKTELEDLLNIYKPKIVVMDSLPNKHLAKELQARFGRRSFFLANERDSWSAGEVSDWIKIDRGQGVIHIERTESLDRLVEKIKNGKESIQFPKNLFQFKAVKIHFSNMIPDYQERFGKIRKVWKKAGRDDFAHAINFYLVGCEIFHPSPEKKVNTGDSPNKIKDPDFLKAIDSVSDNDTIIIKNRF